MYDAEAYTCIVYYLASEASLPSRLNGTIFLFIIGERERANLVVRLARFFYILYIYIYISNFRAHGHRGYPLFADTLHTCSIHIRNVKYKSQQFFCRDISSCFKRFLSKLTARYSDTTLCSTMASHKVRERPDVETA